jgi:transposase
MPTKEVHTMPGATPSYPPEFKREAVRLVRSSPNRSVTQIARELGVSDNSLRNWVKQFEVDLRENGKGSPPKSARNSAGFAKR